MSDVPDALTEEPENPVEDALLRAYKQTTDSRVLRVYNYASTDKNAHPAARDFVHALRRTHDIAARWEVDDGAHVYIRTKADGEFERVRVEDGDTVSNVAQVTITAIEDCCAAHGRPDIVPLDDVLQHFTDGDAR